MIIRQLVLGGLCATRFSCSSLFLQKCVIQKLSQRLQTFTMASVSENADTISYFAYGSNLLAARIHLQNPSATFQTIARLDNYRLEFDYSSKTWGGAAATITESAGDHVWGVVWSMIASERPSLDEQEGVGEGIYKPTDVTVTTVDGKQLNCLTYYLLQRGSPDRRPSPQYVEVMLRGALQHGLPEMYVEQLKNIEHNGFVGPVALFDEIMSRNS